MATEDPGRNQFDREDPRLTSLDARLDQAQRDEAIRSGKLRGGQGKGYSQGNRVLAELIGGFGGGAIVGFTLDYFLGTSPWLLLVLMLLGVVVAFRNIIRISNERPK